MNFEKLKSLLIRIPYSALAVLYGGYLYYEFHSFMFDADSPLLIKKAEIEATKGQNTQIQAKIKAALEFYRTLEAKKVELRSLATELDEMKVTLTEDLDVAAFIKMIVTEAKRAGLTVESVKPTVTNKKEYYLEQVFDLSLKGVYFQILVFLERITNVQRVLRIDSFELKPVGSSSERFVELDGHFMIKAYQYLGSTADDIATGKAGTKMQTLPVGTAPANSTPSGGG